MVKDFLYFGLCVWISGGYIWRPNLYRYFHQSYVAFRGAGNC